MLVSNGRVLELNLGEVRGWFVVDCFVMGLCWGGIRIQSDVTRTEIELLARCMTLKSALAGIPIGGAKLGLAVDPDVIDKKYVAKKIVAELWELLGCGRYIPGTDIGFTEDDLKYLHSLVGRDVRITLHAGGRQLSPTGLAVAESLHASIEALTSFDGMEDAETVVIEGIGNMGSAAAYVLNKRGYTIKAVSNKFYTLYSEEGLDIDQILRLRNNFGERCLEKYIEESNSAKLLPAHSISHIKADIFVPGTRPLTVSNKPSCRIIAPIANYPVSISKAIELERSGVKVIPDIISNAGGAIASALVILQRDFSENLSTVAKITRHNMLRVLESSSKSGKTPIEVSYHVASSRISILRRSGPFGLREYLEQWVAVGGTRFFSDLLKSLKKLSI